MAATARKRTVIRFLVIIITLVGILLARGCAFRPAASYPGSHFNQGKNGIWLGVEWVSDPHTDSEITALAHSLAQHQIRYVFSYVSYLRTDALEFNPKFDHAIEFVKAFKKAEPGINLLAWLGVPMPSLGGAADLADPTIRQKVTAISAHFVHDLGFDGIHLDPETVTSGDQNLIALLDETRNAIGSQAILSLATEKIQPILPDQSFFSAHIGWSSQYYRQIAQHVDQIAVMAYDTGLPIEWLYREMVRFQVIGISQAVSGTGVGVLFGVSTSQEATRTHNPSVETIQNGLQGVIDGLNDLDSVPSAVSGISIYPAWEMDAAKWSFYAAHWLQASP
ncbi:MAG: glycosyl hydrolase family 18 protein [Aggregatilineales bacterium]